MVDLEHARAAKERLRATLQGRAGVRGIGLVPTRQGYRLRVNVSDTSAGSGLPRSVGGVAVEVRVVGQVRAG